MRALQGVGGKGIPQLWQARVGMSHMGQFNADIGLDWLDICVREIYKHPSKPFSFVLHVCSLSLLRVVRGSKLMHLVSLIHGLFIT